VERLVAGASAHICDDCISKCLAVLERHPAPARQKTKATEADRT
jgi:hypothetical protein